MTVEELRDRLKNLPANINVTISVEKFGDLYSFYEDFDLETIYEQVKVDGQLEGSIFYVGVNLKVQLDS